MMDSTVDDDGDFPPNPFRSGPPPSRQQQQPQPPPPSSAQTSIPPTQQQQQQPPMAVMYQEQQDFFSNPMAVPSVDPLSSSTTTTTSVPMDNSKSISSGTAPPQQSTSTSVGSTVTVNTSGTMPAVPPRPTSWWQTCRACCNVQTYQQYFDIDTVDITTRLIGSIVHFYQPDYFRTSVIGVERTVPNDGEGLKGPDLYGPFWITMSVVFLIAVTSNIAAYLHSDNIEEFEYDISHLIRALTILSTWAFVVPTLFWLTTQCMGMQALRLVDWVCLYGYSLVPFGPATCLCLIPVEVIIWISLGVATAMSVVLILRNVAGPLLASDVSQTKSGPLLLAILGTHVILLLTLKLAFYK